MTARLVASGLALASALAVLACNAGDIPVFSSAAAGTGNVSGTADTAGASGNAGIGGDGDARHGQPAAATLAVAAPPPAKVATLAPVAAASSVTKTPIAVMCPSSASHKAAVRVHRASASCAHRCVTTRNGGWCAAATTSHIGMSAFASSTEFRRRRPVLAMWVPRTVTTMASASGRDLCAPAASEHDVRWRFGDRHLLGRTKRLLEQRRHRRLAIVPTAGSDGRRGRRGRRGAARGARGQWARACRPAKRFERGIPPYGSIPPRPVPKTLATATTSEFASHFLAAQGKELDVFASHENAELSIADPIASRDL